MRIAPALIVLAACSSGGGAAKEAAVHDAGLAHDAEPAFDASGPADDAATAETDPAGKLREGRDAAAKQKWAKAMTALDAAASTGDVTALAELAFTATLAGDDRRAARAAQAVLDQVGVDTPTRATAFYHLGRAAELRGDVDAARAAYESSLALRDSTPVSDRLAALGSKRRGLPVPATPPCSKPQPKAGLCACLGAALQIEHPDCTVKSHDYDDSGAYAITVVAREQAPTFLVYEPPKTGQIQVLARLGTVTSAAPDAELTIRKWTTDEIPGGHAIRVDAEMSNRTAGGKLTTVRKDAVICVTGANARCLATVPLTERIGTPSVLRYAALSLEVTDTGGVAHVTLISGPPNPSTLLGSHQLW